MEQIRKCIHGVYDPQGTGVYCGLCNPALGSLIDDQKAKPTFNRRGSLALTETGKLPKCEGCGTILTVSGGGTCQHCGREYEIQAPHNLRANNLQPGICPDCGSGIHYETKSKKIWRCADCDKEYPAPRVTE